MRKFLVSFILFFFVTMIANADNLFNNGGIFNKGSGGGPALWQLVGSVLSPTNAAYIVQTLQTLGGVAYEAQLNNGSSAGFFDAYNSSNGHETGARLATTGYGIEAFDDTGNVVFLTNRTYAASITGRVLIGGNFSAPNGALEIDQNGTPVVQVWADQAKLILGTGNSMPGIFDFDAYNSVGSDGASGFQFLVGNSPTSPGSNINALHILAPNDGTNVRITVNNFSDDGLTQIQNYGAYHGYSFQEGDTNTYLNYDDGTHVWGMLVNVAGPDGTYMRGTEVTGAYGEDVVLADGNGTAINVLGGNTILDNGSITTNGFGTITSTGFIKSGGTSSGFLKADGSVDLTAYSTTHGTVTSVATSTGLSGGTITSSGTLTSNAVYQMSFQPGLITSITSTKSVFGKVSKASTVDNIIGSASSFSCASNPTITMYECGTSATCASSPVTIGTVTVTAAGQAFTGTVSNAAITAGDFVAFAITSGTCVGGLDVSTTAQVHSN